MEGGGGSTQVEGILDKGSLGGFIIDFLPQLFYSHLLLLEKSKEDTLYQISSWKGEVPRNSRNYPKIHLCCYSEIGKAGNYISGELHKQAHLDKLNRRLITVVRWLTLR